MSKSSEQKLSKRLTVTVANKCLASLDQLHGILVQLFKVITRVRDLPWFETQPPDHFQNRVEIDTLFGFGIRIVETEVTTSVVVLGVSEVNGDCFGMSDMEVPIGFGWETGHDFSTSRGKVSLHDLSVGLRVFSRRMESRENTFGEE